MKVSPGAVKRILIQFLLRSCGRWRSPEDWQRSPPPSWSAPPHSPACPCPQCSDLERSCWQRPLYQRQGCLVGKVVCMFHTESESIISMNNFNLQSSPHQWLKAPDPRTQIWEHTCHCQCHCRRWSGQSRCWSPHTYHQVPPHAPHHTTPSRRILSDSQPGPGGCWYILLSLSSEQCNVCQRSLDWLLSRPVTRDNDSYTW